MSRRPVLVLSGLLVLLAVGIAGLWFLTRKPVVPGLEHDQPVAESGLAPAPSGPAPAIEAAAETATPDRHVVEKAAVEKKSAGAAHALTPLEAELKNALWVEGTVVLPDGTPPDERIEVEARGKKFSNDALHSAEVGRDGKYRVAFAAGTRTGWLRLNGRYSYLREDCKVKLPTKAGAAIDPIELKPLLGGWIRGRVLLPLGTSAEGTGLAGTPVQAWRMSFSSGDESDNRRSLSGEIEADLHFDIGGVPGKGSVSLMVDPVSFARVQREEVKVEAGKVVDVEITLKAGARLSGQVVDEDGQPVADAAFFYQAPNAPGGDGWSNFHGKKSAADGSFDLRGAPPVQGTLTVEKEGFLPERQEFGSLAEGSSQPGLRVQLRRGSAISGTVADPQGQPLAGAQVRLRFTPEKQDETQGFSFFGSNEQTTKSDTEGKFRFTGLARGTATLHAEAKPTAGKPDVEAKPVEAAAKSDGEAADEEPAAGKDATAAKAAPKPLKGRKWTAVVEDVQAGTQNVLLALSAGFGIQGRVVDSKGEPLKQFLVRAEPVDKDRKDWEPARGAVSGRFSDDNGKFTLEGLHEGEWMIRAEAKNAPACAPQQIRVPGQESALTLVLASAATVAGVVLDPKGQPVRSARVRAEPERREASRLVFNENKRFSSSTDAEGKFEIDGIPPGPVTLKATSDEWAAADPQALDLAPGARQEALRLVLHAPGRITGLVLDPNGHTDGNRPVSLNGDGDWQQTTSDANGRFAFEKLAPGNYQLSTQAKQEEFAAAGSDQIKINRVWQQQQRSLQVKVSEGATSEVTLGGLPKDAIHLVGHVTCGGRPVPDAFLQTWKHGQAEGDEPQQFHASANDDGSFDLVLGGAGDYSVNVRAEGASSSTSLSFQVKVGSEAQQTHDFELPGARISGRVVDRQGKPQAQVWLQLGPDSKVRGESARNVSGNVSTDEEGRFLFEHVSPGTYEIVCGGGDMGWRSGPRTGRTTRSGLLVEAGKSLEGVEIVVQPACRVEGTVTGPDGTPLAGAQVQAVDEQGKSLTGWNHEVTDGSGHFDFDRLPRGRASFLAQKGSLTTGYSSWVTVQEREPSKVELALVQGTAVFVETANAEGGAVRADMQVFDSRGLDVTYVGRFGDAEGEQLPGRRIGPLAPGKYTLVVMRKEKPDLRQELSVGGEPTKAVRVLCD